MHMGVNRLYRESYQEPPVASRATPGRPASALQFLFRPTARLLSYSHQRQRNPAQGTFPALQLYANRNRGGRKAGTEPSACSCLGAWRATGGRPWTVQDRTLRRTLKGERRHSAYINTAHSESGETDRRGAEIHTPRLRALPGHACGTLPPARLARVAPSDHGRDPSHSCGRVRTVSVTPRSALKSSATGRSLCADAGAPAGLVQLEHLYTPGNCAGDAASVPSWIFSGQLAKSVRNRRTSADGGAGQIPHAWPTAAPRPPSLTAPCPPPSVHRQARWRPTHRYTSSVGNGWTQTQIQGTTDTRTSHQGGRGPQTLTGPYPIAPRQRGSPHTRVSGGHGLRTNAISLNIPSVMQRWVGGHHASATAPTGLMTPEGRR